MPPPRRHSPPRAKAARIAVVLDDSAWLKAIAKPEPLLRRAARIAIEVGRGSNPIPAAVAIALIGDPAMRKLNRLYRGKDKPTNVLSFPAIQSSHARLAGENLGDIALALGTIRREAKEQGKSLADHLTHLVVHGVLHLLGYDHETGRQAERMESLERKALARLGVGDPYRLRPPG